MIKYFCTLFLAFVTTTGLQAQYSNKGIKVANHSRVVSHLLQSNEQHNLASKTTWGTSMQRVIAQSTRDNGLASLSDSVRLTYTGLKGSKYDYNSMIYAYNYPYSTSPMFDYAGVFAEPQVLYDTFVHWTINPFTMPAFGLYEGNFAWYDGNNNLTSFRELFVDSVTNDNRSYENTFTSADKINSGFWFNLNAGVADSAFKQYFTYNSSNKLVKDSIYELHLGVWRIAARTNYTYDASGNLTLINHFANETDTSFLLPLIEQSRYVNTYDGSNRLASVYTSFFNGTVLAPYVKDTFAYSGTLAYHNSWKQYQMDAIHITWWPQFFMSKHLNVAGQPDTVYNMGWDSLLNSWVPGSFDVVSYNSKNNPVTKQNYLYNWTAYSTTPDYTTTYYYDSFLDFTGTQNLAMIEVDMNIFPNPATNNITVLMPEGSDKKHFLLSLVNINGQVIRRQSVLSKKEIEISIDDLAPGLYFVVVQGVGADHSRYTKQFVKR